MSVIASKIVYSTIYSDAVQRKHQSSASLAFLRGIHREPVNSPHKEPVTRKMFHLMTSSWKRCSSGHTNTFYPPSLPVLKLWKYDKPCFSSNSILNGVSDSTATHLQCCRDQLGKLSWCLKYKQRNRVDYNIFLIGFYRAILNWLPNKYYTSFVSDFYGRIYFM